MPDCQKIIKKAVAERLKEKYKLDWLAESGKALYQIQFAIMNDMATLYIDTSGAGLHRRGYRPAGGAAPLRETLAAAIVKLARYRGREAVCDPFCGSGTIPIEAAMAALNRAPGLNRTFTAQDWPWMDSEIWTKVKADARARVNAQASDEAHRAAADVVLDGTHTDDDLRAQVDALWARVTAEAADEESVGE